MKKTFLLFSLLLLLGGCSASNSNPAVLESEIDNSTDETKALDSASGKQMPAENIDKLNNNQMAENNTSASKDLTKEYNFAILKTNLGDIKLAFYADASPLTVNNFLTLAESGFYDNTRFHRVIKDFMIQGGDPKSKDIAQKSMWGTGDPGYKFADEFNDNKLVRGSLAMANSGPNTNGSQFFIVTAEATPWLDGKHTNFGYVAEGLEIVSEIEAGATDGNDRPLADVIIESIELVK